MKQFLLDAQLPAGLAVWIGEFARIPCFSTHFLGISTSSDEEIFEWAKENDAAIITKDIDFLRLQNRLGAPPKVIWIRSGNTSRFELKALLERSLIKAIELLEENDLVEIQK